MANKFIHDPIKVVVKNPTNNNIRHVYTFVGNVPTYIRKIISAENFKDNKQALREYYGNNWREKLGLSLSAVGGDDTHNDKYGGDADADDADADDADADDADADIDANDFSFARIPADKSAEYFPDLGEDDRDANDAIDITENDLLISTRESSEETVKKILTIGDNVDIDSDIPDDSGITFITDIAIYPEDKIKEIKEKIYVATNIPYYRMHLYWMEQGKVNIPYNLYISGLYSINIEALFPRETADANTNTSEIFGIPVDKLLYASRAEIRIETLEQFTIAKNIRDFANVFYVVDVDQFIRKIRTQLNTYINDSYQFDLFYFGFIVKFWPQMTHEVFHDYVLSELELYQKYPDLARSKRFLREMYTRERAIIDAKYCASSQIRGLVDKKQVMFAITNIVITTTNPKVFPVNIRNLFDKFRISVKYPQSHAYVEHEGKKYLLKKAHIRNQSDILFPALFKQGFIVAISLYKKDQENFHRRSSVTTIENEQSKYVYLNVLANGQYFAKAIWNDEDGGGFDETYKIVKDAIDPVIATINGFGRYVFPAGGQLVNLTRANVQFYSLNMSIFWKKLVSESIFRLLKTLWDPYIEANIIGARLIQQPNAHEFMFRKGMYDFDPGLIVRVMSAMESQIMSNQYAYLSNNTVKQKWEQLYDGRVVRMIHRTTDIKFEVMNIHEAEFNIFIDYLLNFVAKSLSDPKILSAISRKIVYGSVKKLKKLKETDPELYNLKKYGSKRVYSILCQNPRQPVIYTEDELAQMPASAKKNLVKYWNFTLNRDAYYGCPSRKYPHLMFMVGIHPKEYCLPCCGKEAQSGESKKAFINQVCLARRRFTRDDARKRDDIGEDGGISRHIINYGKVIDPGRLSRLPPSGIRRFIYTGHDDRSAEYLIMGVPQSLPSAESVGLLFAIAETLGKSADEIIRVFIEAVQKKPKIFNILANGILSETFKDAGEFIGVMRNIFVEKKMLEVYMRTPFKRWSDLFIEMSMYYLNLYIFIFIDDTGRGETTDLYVNDLIKYEILTAETSGHEHAGDSDMSQKKYMLCMKKSDSYFPVFLIDPEEYFKTYSVKKKLFKRNDSPIVNIVSAIRSSAIQRNQVNKVIDLNMLKEYCAADKKYRITEKYINSRNFVYAVTIADNSGTIIYFPIDYSANITDKIDAQFGIFSRREHQISFEAIRGFIYAINKFIGKKYIISAVENIYEYAPITVKSLVRIRGSDKVIGLYTNSDFLIYFTEYNPGELPQNIKTIELMHDPEDVNAAILAKHKPTADNRTQNIGISLYNGYLYQLFLSEFINFIEEEKNDKLRKKIIDLIHETNFKKDLAQFQTKLSAVLRGSSSRDAPASDGNNPLDSDEKADNKKLQEQLYTFYYGHFDKKLFIEDITNTKYNFDRKTLNRLKRMRRSDLITELARLAEEFAIEGEINADGFTFPNVYIPCKYSRGIDYCEKNKLIINRDKNELVKILAADITNPLKEKYMFSGLITENIINYFNFENTADDLITIIKM